MTTTTKTFLTEEIVKNVVAAVFAKCGPGCKTSTYSTSIANELRKVEFGDCPVATVSEYSGFSTPQEEGEEEVSDGLPFVCVGGPEDDIHAEGIFPIGRDSSARSNHWSYNGLILGNTAKKAELSTYFIVDFNGPAPTIKKG